MNRIKVALIGAVIGALIGAVILYFVSSDMVSAGGIVGGILGAWLPLRGRGRRGGVDDTRYYEDGDHDTDSSDGGDSGGDD